jgi:hypothetical protein
VEGAEEEADRRRGRWNGSRRGIDRKNGRDGIARRLVECIYWVERRRGTRGNVAKGKEGDDRRKEGRPNFLG